ncbi:MAG: hypothetical protein H6708_31450 [Kofleriaceae bacterium]|nr:hypothetical protein [Kofleriaceae bacterium]
MAHDHDHPTPEQDAQLARDALAQNDLPHALHHIGCALASNPMHPEWFAVLNDIIGRAPDPMALVQIEGDVSFIDAANRSYVLAWMRQWEEALDLITDVAEIRPDIPYLLWAEWWLGQPGVAQSLTWEQFARGILVDLAKIASKSPIPTPRDDPRMANLQAAWRIIASIRGLHAQQAFVWFTASMLSRRLGNLDEGLAMAQHAYNLEPAWKNAIGIANIYRDLDKVADAVTWFRKALDHDKDDVSAHLDMGDMFLDHQRWDEGIAEYEKVLRKQADHPWAQASIYYARFKQSGDPTQRLCLLRMTEDDGDTHRARMLARELDPPVPYLTFLPRPADASCNALNHIFEQMYENPASHHGSTLTLKLSHVESPSVVAAFALQMEMWGPQVTLDYQVEKVQTPDPRQPKTQVAYTLWQWDGNQPRPALPKPDPQVARAVFFVASEPYHPDIWTPLAEKAARELGPGAIGQLLATMVHPPRPDGGKWRVLNWTQRCQVAAALILGHIDGGWQGSQRQRVLYSLLYGPSDWTTIAAITVMGLLSRKDPAIRAEVVQAFAWLQSQIPAEGFCPWEYALANVWLGVGGHDDLTTKRLEQWIEKIENNETGSSTVHAAQLEAKKFDQAEEMAKAQAAQAQLAAGGGGDPDPMVFPGQPLAKLSDYVGLMREMQRGNMMGALSALGLDMMSYGQAAQAWGQKLAADPVLNAKFSAMMTG